MGKSYYFQPLKQLSVDNMLSNGEIYHMAFNLHDEFLKKGIQVPVVELRDHLKELNEKDLSKPELEEKAREWAREKMKR